MAKSLTIPAIINGDYEQVAVSSLKFHPRNARQGDLGAIIENIKANGFYGACVVQRSTRHVIIGNHRLRAAVELGLPAVPVIWLECDNDRALRLMLSDNQTSDIATNDPNALAELLAELAATDNGLAGTGFDGEDLDQLIADLAGPDEFPSIIPNTKHAMTLWYEETDEDAIKSFIGESGPGPIDPKRGGGQVLERIKTIAQTRPGE